MKLLYSSENRVLIRLLKAKLEAQAIITMIKNEDPPLAGEVPPIMAPPELWVMRDEQYAEAAEILARELAIDHDTGPWRCKNCHADNPSGFEICWQCSQAK